MNMTTLNTPLPEDLMKLKWNGQFKLMQEMIDLRLQKDIPTKLKERLELEKELISRLPENFTYSKEDAIELLKSKISDFKDEEFDELFKDNAFEWIFIEGKMYLKDNFFENLIKVRKAYKDRLIEKDGAASTLLDEVQAILKYMPKKHVTCLFSATYPAVIQRMSKKYLYKPAKVDLTSTNKPNILEEAYHVNEEHKELFLLHLLALKKPESCMIFCKTQARVDEVYACLEKNQVSVDKIHGGMMQEERLSHMRRFKKGKVRILVCTDVASRGIDVFKVEMIINYDMPSPVETYTHRIGRSGRVNEQGLAISLVNEYDGVRKEKLEEYLGYNLPFKDEGEVYLSDLDVLDSLKESNRVVVDKSKDLRKGITKIYLNGGKNKKIRPGDIVGAICEIDGVTVDDIGVIQVQDHQSYVDILNNKGKLVLKNLKTIKGKTLRIQKAKNGFGH